MAALTPEENAGFAAFTAAGCVTCHRGALVGGQMYNRLGVVKPWPDTRDPGRYEITRNERDRMVFKVPSLRNVAETAPYFHDGSIASLERAIRLMAEFQLGREVPDDELKAMVAWLGSLSGSLQPLLPVAAQQRCSETEPRPKE
ncbi:MAG: c-type cytochrome, partial [bacterium]|nr:c-type cytochrome [bacterium]